MVIGMVSRCMMGRLQQVASALPPCRGWTWRLCPPGSVLGRMGLEQGTPERESPPELTEVRADYRSVIDQSGPNHGPHNIHMLPVYWTEDGRLCTWYSRGNKCTILITPPCKMSLPAGRPPSREDGGYGPPGPGGRGSWGPGGGLGPRRGGPAPRGPPRGGIRGR